MVGRRMQQYFRTAEHEHASGLGIHDFATGHHGDVAEVGLRHRERALDSVAIEIPIHEVVR